MCGIVGYIGERSAQDVLMKGLKSLEYRGYDSAGLAILDDDTIAVSKEEGKLDVLAEALANHPLKGHVGIGHTRWATHGKPSQPNAHPHLGPEGKIAVVHNGIIENYQELKKDYLEGHIFRSETDTEVVAHLLEHFYEGDIFQTVLKVKELIEGSYALEIISSDEPDRIVVCRKESPLVLGLGDGEQFVASDVPALLSYTKKCAYLENGHLALVQADGVRVFSDAGIEVPYEVDDIQWSEEAAEKGGYDHFMIKEIFEQPHTFHQVMAGRLEEDRVRFKEFELSVDAVCAYREVYIVACGTAYHSGLVGKTILEKALKRPVSVEVASEFRYRDPMMDENSLVILISQSGETADTMAALREAKAKGATTLAITNVVGSAISREADMVIYLWAGPEISVASTKAYTSMLIALYLLGLYLGERTGHFSPSFLKEMVGALKDLPQQAQKLLSEESHQQVQILSENIQQAEHLFYIGRGMDWAVAQEGALKLKEISYIHAEAYAAGELKHGTLALITAETPVITVALQEDTFDKTMSNMQEVLARGASSIVILPEGRTYSDERVCIVHIPACPDFLSPALAAIPLQLLAYHTAKNRGCNIDQPRNLAKSVTVE